jgi:DNA-binding MarR family transcriptional regulator
MTSLPSPPAFSSPRAELFLRLLRVADRLNRAFQLRLRPFQLTHPQYNVLRILRAAPPEGLTCSTIGYSMITAEPDITRLLARLRVRKLVAQSRDADDGRVVWTRITARGLALLAELDPIVEKEPQNLLRALSEEQVRELNSMLQLLGRVSSPDKLCTGAALCPDSASASSDLTVACPGSVPATQEAGDLRSGDSRSGDSRSGLRRLGSRVPDRQAPRK